MTSEEGLQKTGYKNEIPRTGTPKNWNSKTGTLKNKNLKIKSLKIGTLHQCLNMNASISPFINYLLANRIMSLENGDRFCTHINKVIQKQEEKKRKKLKILVVGNAPSWESKKSSKIIFSHTKAETSKKN